MRKDVPCRWESHNEYYTDGTALKRCYHPGAMTLIAVHVRRGEFDTHVIVHRMEVNHFSALVITPT
eukprot:1184647-Prorocentrum_minimum.AAC.1